MKVEINVQDIFSYLERSINSNAQKPEEIIYKNVWVFKPNIKS